jgi:TolB-like protein/Flp pilus assembly protein TadD
MFPNWIRSGMATNYKLGPFRLDAKAEILFLGAEPVALGQRAVALLRVLVERAGVPVSKNALIEAAWPGLAVEESNLSVQIAALRRVLGQEAGGEGCIETLPRRGYRYVGPVAAMEDGGGGAATMARETPALALPDKPSIAVLPFANLSGDPEQEYFADGVVEDIITGLSRIRWLFVIARNSSFTYKWQALDVKRVGRELGVRYLLEGSVRKEGARVRINAQLVEAETGTHLWAERYDRPLGDIFALQDEITLSVVGAIEPSLRAAEIERVKRKRPDNLDAYDLVLRALPHVYLAMPKEAAKALPFLESALALESDYAGAHGFLAWCHQTLFMRGGFSDGNRATAIRHARAAVSDGRDDATALALGAFVLAMVEHDRVTAFEAFEQALALSSSSSFALFLGCVALAWAGEAERAIDWGERALRISPFDRLNYCSYIGLAVSHFLRGRYEQAANAGRRAVQANPGFSSCHSLLAAPLAKLGRVEEAKAVAARVLALQPSFSARGFCTALALPAALAESLTDAWCRAGLPP